MSEDKPMNPWPGRILTGIAILGLTASAAGKLSGAEKLAEQFKIFGYPSGVLTYIGVVELLCVVLYAIPQTAVLGAILISAYLGGAVATHVRIGDPWVAPVVVAAIAWGGLWFRDARLRALLPIRKA